MKTPWRSTSEADSDVSRLPARALRAGSFEIGFAIFFFLWIGASDAHSAASALSPSAERYLEILIARAEAQSLARDPQWRALLHYRVHPVTRRHTSHVDDADFFASPAGASDLEGELDATLRAFFEQELRPLGDSERQHSQCAWKARYVWLKAQLEFDPNRLPERSCPGYDEWIAALDPAGLTLIFAEAFMNNPASMFGHTLLRVDSRESLASVDLLGWAINYSGATGGDSGPVYAMKGVFGFYPGFYDVQPYYEKVKEYGDWENRDIWEYPIALAPAELERLLMHLWELQGIAFDYFYFDENCSYQLLALLEVARPTLDMTSRFPLWVIPSDTVRVALDGVGLLGPPTFRPSAATELRAEIEQLAPGDLERVQRLVDGSLQPTDPSLNALSDLRRAAVLAAAYDVLRYAYLAKEIDRKASAARARRILVARSQVDVSGTPFDPVPVPRVRPDQGHGSARFALATGYREGAPYVEARFRPALHDWTDAIGGYTPGAQIQLFDLAFRYLPHDRKLRLHELVLLDLGSLVPWDPIFRKVSYAFDTGLRTRWRPDGEDLEPELLWRTRGSYGFTAAITPNVWAYGLAEMSLDVGASLTPEYAVGLGPRLGIQWRDTSDRFSGHWFGRATGYAVGDTTTAAQVGFEQRWRTSRHTAWVLSANWNRDFHNTWYDTGLRWNIYF